jgi:hypothetical protein
MLYPAQQRWIIDNAGDKSPPSRIRGYVFKYMAAKTAQVLVIVRRLSSCRLEMDDCSNPYTAICTATMTPISPFNAASALAPARQGLVH